MTQPSATEMLAELERLGIRLGLDVFRALLERLGNPHLAAPVALIAGTNGKGSTAALLDSIARAAGLRVGLATSPHLESVTERIRLAGEPIAEASLTVHLARILDAARLGGLALPTYFEATTAAAFLAFAQSSLDLAVVEVGMGGRLDATNAAEPVLSVVTPIALDHTAELGTTLAAVAGEKAGIFRADRPGLIAAQPAEADSALAGAAHRVGARLVRVGDLVRVGATEWRGLAGHRLVLELDGEALELDLPLAGEHQILNTATAVAAATLLARAGVAPIDVRALRAGVAAARWPGRLEALPAPGRDATVLLDAAHNPHGCAALARFLDRLDRPFTLLFGALGDKDFADMLPPLAERAAAVVLTRPDSPRAIEPSTLLPLVPQGRRVEVARSPGAALERALSAGPDLVVACGSIYLIGALRTALRA